MDPADLCIVVVAAGSSLRFGSDKLLATLRGRTVLERAINAIRTPFPAAQVALVVRPDAFDEQRLWWEPSGVRVAVGGRRRQDSVRSGLGLLDPADDMVVLIHDGARPFVPPGDVRAVAAEARRCGAAILSAPVVDTIKRLRDDGIVDVTLAREGLVRSLTPQAFRISVLRQAWKNAAGATWTDEAALIESQGGTVKAIPGDPRNVKVTRREDLSVVAAALPQSFRVGQGIDVHAFQQGRRLVLCGIEVPSEVGLLGHSDADVALHAVTDAILGGCGHGDIGEHFPPTDERWRDADSTQFVRRALQLAKESGWTVTSCDLTLLAEQPRIGPYREAMRANLAGLLGLEVPRTNVKATTCEGLGFVGRGEGIMAMAVVTLELA